MKPEKYLKTNVSNTLRIMRKKKEIKKGFRRGGL